MIERDVKLDFSSENFKKAKEIISKVFRNNKSNEEIFYDLCFCLLVTNSSFKAVRPVITKLWELDFYHRYIERDVLEPILRPARYYRMKTTYLILARRDFSSILNIIKSDMSNQKKRDWLCSNVKGLGMKASSHFLRNLGAVDLAIVDTHIVKFLHVDMPSSRKQYLNIEERFLKAAETFGVKPVVLDAVVWKSFSNTEWEKFVF